MIVVFRPAPGFAFNHPAHFIAFGFGAGLSRWAPGTLGTLVAWPLAWLLQDLEPAVLFGLIAGFFLLGVWACELTGRDLGIEDHGAMVWDEVVAFLLVLALIPAELDWQAAAFVLFRAFDIGKPSPIRELERRFRGGFGVMFDDIVAAGYTVLVLALVKRIFF